MNREIDLAYFAGIIDGEGCIQVYPVFKYGSCTLTLSVKVGNTYRPLLDWLCSTFEGGHMWRHVAPTGPGYRQMWYWEMPVRRNLAFFEELLPYLKEKGPQLELAIEAAKLNSNNSNKKISVALTDKNVEIAAEVKRLKKIAYQQQEGEA